MLETREQTKIGLYKRGLALVNNQLINLADEIAFSCYILAFGNTLGNTAGSIYLMGSTCKLIE